MEEMELLRVVRKAATKMVKAAQRQLADQEFRQTLLKERAGKLEYWMMKKMKIEEKKKDKNELVRRQSSMWIDEAELVKKVLEAIVDTTPL
ncbi:hypothetical protein LOK49_LG06G02370 [Camellia lanceoleosa]|uniref:Uncharacterized protein n=1 Tax=Camellia lanceoleosa TaxID=1840588 RepID=A0ACC0HEC4_9ERIC|nr:hypothetical protein LOK49_LG06G02370 [Camellia lanceoleosa]